MASTPASSRGITLQRQLAQVPITSAAFYAAASGNKFFLAGQDGDLAIYEDAPRPASSPAFCLPVFEDQPIHGIRVQGSRILLWGAARIALFDGGPLAERCRPLLLATATAPDWIHDAAVSPFCVDDAVLATAHNEVVVMKYCLSGQGWGRVSLGDVVSPSRPMLYAARLAWVSRWRVLVAAGTVFGDVLVWTYSVSGDELSVSFVLRGHEGSIYGVDISPPLLMPDGSRRRLLASCSDDRTIRIWDISPDGAAAAASRASSAPHSDAVIGTGFKAAETCDRLHADSGEGEAVPVPVPVPVAVAMGHASRIWGVKFAVGSSESECVLGKSSLCVYSFGEDATTQRWELLDLHAGASARLTGTLAHQRTYSLHHGKHLWARALDVGAHGVGILTGGADGKISVIQEPALHDDRDDAASGSSLATIDVPDLLASLSGGPAEGGGGAGGGPSGEVISRYDFLSGDRVLAITNLGRLFVGDLPRRRWEQVPLSEHFAEDLKRCYVPRRMGCRGCAAVIGTTNGKVYHFRQDQGLVLSAEVPGRIVEINHLSSDPQATHLLVHLHGSSSSHLLTLDSSGVLLQRRLLAGLDPRFVAVSATRLGHLLVLGSRHGWICLLSLQDEAWRPVLDVATRSRDAITCIVVLPAAAEQQQSGTCPPYILATSRDGKYRIYRVDGAAQNNPSLVLLHETAPPFGPMIEGAWFTDGATPELLLYGFRSKDFVIWNESTGEELATVDCGGAHRTFRLHHSMAEPQRYRFAYTRTSKMCIYSQRGVAHRAVRRGTHGREIRALGSNGRFIASGAEDASIRIWECGDDGGATMRNLACMKAHVTGLQKLRWFEDDYLFSSAGNEEFFAWRVTRLDSAYAGLAVVCEGVFTDKSALGDLRIMDFDVSRREDDGILLVTLAFSNSSLRTYEYHGRGGAFGLCLSVGSYTGACITRVRHLGKGNGNNKLCIMTASTDGHLALWATDLDGRAGPQSYLLRAVAPVHQSSIKSLDMVTDGSKYIVVTGGDDNAVGFVQIAEVEVAVAQRGASTNYGFASRGVVRRAHAAAVNGVALLPTTGGDDQNEMLAVSVSNDQRVKVWRISTDGAQGQRVTLAACMSSGVADPGDVAVVCAARGQPSQIVLGGVGLEAWRVVQSGAIKVQRRHGMP
ncbi:hypothetical protein C2857_003086 [Epichloe festucae Fl1]|uniref:Uncharacterized protein n=1 Tax=Epichloe festucae (strain Fl1) TaxID=877507 RepID=A0A7S9KNS1_EPIFF|nr:hypothetical protein C2857_003086 [Epichloe festucae Fl1]